MRITFALPVVLTLLMLSCDDSTSAPAVSLEDVSDVSSADTPSGSDLVDPPDVPPAAEVDEDANVPSDPEIVAGASRVVFANGALELRRGDAVRLRFAASAFEIGVVPAIDVKLNYDPSFFEPGAELTDLYFPPEGLEWLPGESLEFTGGLPDSLDVSVRFKGGRMGTVSVTVSGDDRLTARWNAGEGNPAAYFRLRASVSKTEGFYGLGEVFDTPSHRGKVRPLQVEPSAILESVYNEVHVPVPFLIGTTGWGLFVESLRPAVFAVAVEADDVVRSTTGVGDAWKDGLTFHLFTADHALDVTRRYYETTGFPKLPAPWALGPLIWRDETAGQAEVEGDLHAIRERDLATSGFWIDRPYASSVNSFDFEPSDYPDPAAMIQLAQSLGFRMSIWHTPYLDPKEEPTTTLAAEATSKGFFPPVRGAEAKWGPLLDFTNAAAVAWWQEKLSYYKDIGIEGYKLDYGEEVIPGAFGLRSPWLFSDGSTELTMHRAVQNLYHKTYAAMLPEEGGFLLCRSGVYGDQVNGPIIWPGDIDATLSKHGQLTTKPDGETYYSVGGLPAAIAAGSSLGPSGYPFFAADTGGYRNSPPDKETYLRWMAQSAFTPAMQVGTSANDLPWRFGDEHVEDPQIVDTYRRYARWHMRLFPYIWTYAKALLVDGRPIQRPLGLAYDVGSHPAEAYALGDELVIAPVITPGATTVTLPLPAGGWTDLQTGIRTVGGTEVTLPAPIDHIPALLRDGGILPLLRDTIDTMSPVTSPDIDSFVTTPGPLVVRVAPHPDRANRTLTLYDASTIAVDYGADGTSVTVTLTGGEVFDVDLIVELHGPAPKGATVDGQAIPAVAEADLANGPGIAPFAAGTRVRLPAGKRSVTLTW